MPSSMYSFMKNTNFTLVNLEGTRKCKIVYNHWWKTAKISSRWRYFAAEKNLEAGQEVIFEFLNPEENFSLF